MQLESCCCVCSLRDGSLFIGWFNAIISNLKTIALIICLHDDRVPAYIVSTGLIKPEDETTLKILADISLAIFIPTLCLAMILLIGVYMNKTALVNIWVVGSFYLLVMKCFLYAMPLLRISFIFLPLDIYELLVVYSFSRGERHGYQRID